MIAFLFPGQGAQSIGMLSDIFQAYPQIASDTFAVAKGVLGRDIEPICVQGPQETLDMTVNTQPCILTVEEIARRVLLAQDIQPDMVAGFSLGEWSALVAADVMTFEQTVRIIETRAEAMQAAVPPGAGAMAVILGKTGEEVEQLCQRAQGQVFPSNYNFPKQITVAGTTEGIDSLLDIAQQEGIAAKRLAVSVPSHCPLMRPAAEVLRKEIEGMAFNEPSISIVMNATGKLTSSASEIKENLIQQLVSPVLFEQSLSLMIASGVDTFIEVGPGKTLSGFIRKIDRSINTLQVNSVETLEKTVKDIKG